MRFVTALIAVNDRFSAQVLSWAMQFKYYVKSSSSLSVICLCFRNCRRSRFILGSSTIAAFIAGIISARESVSFNHS
jgi:hypothetical protein